MTEVWLLTVVAKWADSRLVLALSSSLPAWPALRMRMPSDARHDLATPRRNVGQRVHKLHEQSPHVALVLDRVQRQLGLLLALVIGERFGGAAHPGLLFDQHFHLGRELGDAQAPRRFCRSTASFVTIVRISLRASA